MRRRDFLAAAACAASTRVAFANEIRRVGMLIPFTETADEIRDLVESFRRGLASLGWIEGRNLRLVRATDGDFARLAPIAEELVRLGLDALEGMTTPATAALVSATATIPIVFTIVSDPIGSGFIESFSRPGRNATGFVNVEPAIVGKYMEVLAEAVPRLKRIVFLYNPRTTPNPPAWLAAFELAARARGLAASRAPVVEKEELGGTTSALAGHSDTGVVVSSDSFLTVHRDYLVSLAARHRLPAVYPTRQFARAGGLMSYGQDSRDVLFRTAAYVDRVLRGATPGELPVQAPTKFELYLNAKTATELGLSFPPSLLARADEVIE